MRANKSMQWMFLAAALLALPSLAIAQQGEVHVGKVTGHSDAGKQLYFRFCWGCHGFRGDGNGENGPYLNILPRNFVAATFKCRSTPTGTLPTDEDLYDSVGRGFNNSNMPAWNSLTKLECWKCHGQEGRGDGPSAPTLTDSNDQPIRPYNFAAGSRFKCGATNHDLYKVFMTGLDGTPMPSFADVIKPEDAWDLVHYLRTLQVTAKSPELALWMTSKEGAEIVKAQKITGTPTGAGIKQ